MSDLFRANVVSRVEDTVFETGPEFETNTYDFAEIAYEAFGTDEKELTIPGLWEKVRTFSEGKSYDEVAAALSPTFAFNPDLVEPLANEPWSIKPTEMEFANWHWVGHTILAELFPDEIKPLVTTKVVFDTAKIHPDAGVPDGLMLRFFSLRLLAEATGEFFDNRIWNWFEQFGPEGFLTLPNMADDALVGLVFGCGVLERTPIVTGEKFGVGHEEAWWASDQWVRQLLSQGPEEEGFEAVRLWIRVPSKWIDGELVEGVFDSRAY